MEKGKKKKAGNRRIIMNIWVSYIFEWEKNLIPENWLNKYDEKKSSFNWQKKYVKSHENIILSRIKDWRKKLKKTRSIKHFDKFRKTYDTITFEKLVKKTNIWNLEVDKKYNALIASHMIEHIKWRELVQLIRWIPKNIQTVLFEVPIAQSAEDFNWKGHYSTHILEKGWEQIVEEMRAYNFVKVFSEKDTVIFTRI